ncbi:MAG TPA: GTPase [Pseudonocardiaceae bacterium]
MRPTTGTLIDAVRALLHHALGLYRGSPRATHWLRRHLARLDEPLSIAVAGLPGSGKSTLINALVGEQVAPVTLPDGAPVPTWYRYGPALRAQLHPTQGPPRDLPATHADRRLHLDTPPWPAQQTHRIVVDLPARALRESLLVDTPPVTPTTPAGSGPTAQQVTVETDALLYLAHPLRGTDLHFLQAGHDHPIARFTPVTTILVLARADEIGGMRVDAVTTARRIARRRHRDVALHGLCQNVVAVAGLVAQAGRTLREEEFTALTELAHLPRTELEDALLSTDRFGAPDSPLPLDAARRRHLLDRLGPFGIRLATVLVRQGCTTPTALAAQLVQRSGLSELRDAIRSCFVDRRDVLKARSALLALEVVLRHEPHPEASRLLANLEALLAGAHDFQELRALAALHSGRTVLPGKLGPLARRLLGGEGTTLVKRLGLGRPTDPDTLRTAVLDALRHWQEQVTNPLLDTDQQQVARVVLRSCEGMLARLRVS